MDEETSTSIVQCVFDAYERLGSNGKPFKRNNGDVEWTILAGIVLSSSISNSHECVALGTGLKALPFSRLPIQGDVLHDSHAEVIARRSFHLYLYSQIKLARGDLPSCLERAPDRRWKLKDEFTCCLYVSTLPCGDASTYSLSLLPPVVLSRTSSSITPSTSMLSAQALGLNTTRGTCYTAPEGDINSEATPDLSALSLSVDSPTPPVPLKGVQRGRSDYSSISTLRTKPGRADSIPTTSHSCSDKISLWNVIGLQGALLTSSLERIRLDAIIIGQVSTERARVMAEVERGIGGRLRDQLVVNSDEFGLKLPSVHFTDLTFIHSKERVSCDNIGGAVVSCAESISFAAGEGVEIIVNGIKKGAAMKRQDAASLGIKSRSRLCKLSLFERYASLYPASDLTYFNAKHSTTCVHTSKYQRIKECIRGSDGPFRGWLVSGESFEDFNV